MEVSPYTHSRRYCGGLPGRHPDFHQDRGRARASGPTGVTSPEGEQTLPPPREVRVLQAMDQVLGSGHLGEQSFHGSGQSRRSLRMAYSREQDGRPGFPRLRELLLEVHSGLFCQSSTPL